MYVDTEGNIIQEIIDICDCGLTGGCERCNSSLIPTTYGNIIRR